MFIALIISTKRIPNEYMKFSNKLKLQYSYAARGYRHNEIADFAIRDKDTSAINFNTKSIINGILNKSLSSSIHSFNILIDK